MRVACLACSLLLAVVLLVPHSAVAWTDPCKHYLTDINLLKKRIADDEKKLDMLQDSNSHTAGLKEAQLLADIAQAQQTIGIDQVAYDQCELLNPPPTPALSQGPFVGLSGSNDPQLAVGHNWLVAIDGQNFYFYRRQSDGSFNTAAPAMTFATSDVFNGLIPDMNTAVDAALQAGLAPIRCVQGSPSNPSARGDTRGCIDAFYDARVYYDAGRDRFWFAAAARHPVWQCDSDNDGTMDGILWKTGPSTTSPCTFALPTAARRFIVVAVTRPGVDSEDPNNGFYTWTLVNDYADWPQIMVHGDYLLLNHKDLGFGQLRLYVFNATSLANGDHDGEFMPFTAWKYDATDFNTTAYDWSAKASVDVALDTAQAFVNAHGTSVTYLVGGYQNYLVIYGLVAPPKVHGVVGKPTVLEPAVVDIGRWVYEATNFAVFRKGRINVTWTDCFGLCGPLPFQRRYLRVVRVPTHQSQNFPNMVWASNDGAAGYMTATLGTASGDTFSYARPGIEVTANDDLVMSYARVGFYGETGSAPQARYSVLYHKRARFSASKLLHAGDGLPTTTDSNGNVVGIYPADGGNIDLVGLAIDPDDASQVWMSHAFAGDPSNYVGVPVNGSPSLISNYAYIEVVGAVKP